MKKVKFAVVGNGHIGKRHAEMITRNEGAELAALCDIRPKEELGIENYQVPFYQSIEELLASDTEFDVLTVSTPNGIHAAHSLLALEAGKHIVCEKPMGLSKADCEEIIHVSLKNNKQVFCVMQNRYSPPRVVPPHHSPQSPHASS